MHEHIYILSNKKVKSPPMNELKPKIYFQKIIPDNIQTEQATS